MKKRVRNPKTGRFKKAKRPVSDPVWITRDKKTGQFAKKAKPKKSKKAAAIAAKSKVKRERIAARRDTSGRFAPAPPKKVYGPKGARLDQWGRWRDEKGHYVHAPRGGTRTKALHTKADGSHAKDPTELRLLPQKKQEQLTRILRKAYDQDGQLGLQDAVTTLVARTKLEAREYYTFFYADMFMAPKYGTDSFPSHVHSDIV